MDGTREPERHDYLPLPPRHVVLAIELETLGVFDEATLHPLGPSTPPPG